MDVKSLTMDELKHEMEKIGEKAFRAKQLYEWMHVKLARSYDEMTNIPKNLRQRLVRDYPYTALEEVTVQVSKTDGTRKYLLRSPTAIMWKACGCSTIMATPSAFPRRWAAVWAAVSAHRRLAGWKEI